MKKDSGKPDDRKGQVRFDVAGAGNGFTVELVRHRQTKETEPIGFTYGTPRQSSTLPRLRCNSSPGCSPAGWRCGLGCLAELAGGVRAKALIVAWLLLAALTGRKYRTLALLARQRFETSVTSRQGAFCTTVHPGRADDRPACRCAIFRQRRRLPPPNARTSIASSRHTQTR